VHGQAVLVDLGSRGFLFALLDGQPTNVAGGHGAKYFPDEPADVAVRAFLHRDVWSITSLDTVHELALHKETVELSPDELPRLVRFRDIRNPTTVEQVNPRDLTTSFGAGVELIGAMVAITNDPVVIDIEKTLPWLKDLNGAYLTGKHSALSSGLADTLHVGNFEF
jgi:hypothetical protein